MTQPRRKLLAGDRASILLVLVPYLISKQEVSLVEAADEFDVLPNQMREMVERLTLIGRPGEDGYAPMPQDMFDIDWDLLDDRDLIRITNVVALDRSPKLSTREAAALLAGLQLARALPGVGDSTVFTSLLSKLSRGATSTLADVIVAPGRVDEVRVTVADALRRGVAVSFRYKAPDAPATTRTVDPMKVLIADGQWYLQGWCHLREAPRTFHLERVSDLTLTEIAIEHRTMPSDDLFHPSSDAPTATIRFPAAIAPLLGDFLAGAEMTQQDAAMTATLEVADAHALKRLVARLGGAVEIMAPESARQTAAAWARAGLEQYH